MRKLIFVTGNHNKLADMRRMMSNFEIDHVEFEVPEIQSIDPVEVAKYKIKYAYEQIKKPCFVIDAGVNIEVLNGFPGAFVKPFYKCLGIDGIANLIKKMGNGKCIHRIVLAYYNGKTTKIFETEVKGEFLTKSRGKNGYDWDPLFLPLGYKKTNAEMEPEEKAKMFENNGVVKQFIEYLEFDRVGESKLK